MEFDLWWSILGVVLGTYVFLFVLVKKVNNWYYVRRLGEKQKLLPPGEMGWPLVGNMLSFLRAFKSQDPYSFINDLIKRHGETGIYKSSLFWNPSIIVCSPELCKKVLTNDEQFCAGYNDSSLFLGESSHVSTPSTHKNFHKISTARLTGQEAQSAFIKIIEEIVVNKLDEWSMTTINQPIQFFTKCLNLSFKVIITIFLGYSVDDSILASMEKHYECLYEALFSTEVNIPGFTFHKALKVTFIPKGWKVLVWQSFVHMNPKVHANPKEFLPSRWDDFKPKAGAFLPFGTGKMSCPGSDLVRLEIPIFLHYFLLNYKLEQLNPGAQIKYLPSPKPADKCPAKIIKLR